MYFSRADCVFRQPALRALTRGTHDDLRFQGNEFHPSIVLTSSEQRRGPSSHRIAELPTLSPAWRRVGFSTIMPETCQMPFDRTALKRTFRSIFCLPSILMNAFLGLQLGNLPYSVFRNDLRSATLGNSSFI
jgi:hypothetical protein